ncbi:molybdenum cofactor synthesis domain protein [delta proteobacterium NaphS2]|nr:molybdenum cofactor synthesis domain protein [delta proteobacterium NaphS2]
MENKIRAGVLTISTKGAAGLRDDESGDRIRQMLENHGINVLKRHIVPDQLGAIADTLVAWVDQERLPLIVTTGGTGLSPNDVTPQAMETVIDFQVPGMAEAMRAESLKKTPHAMISRAMVGVRKASLIINLPGSPKGVGENLSVVLPALNHALAKLGGDTSDCAPQT